MDLILDPGRICDGLFFGFPHVGIAYGYRESVRGKRGSTIGPASRTQMLIRPTMSADEVFTTLKRDRFSGFEVLSRVRARPPNVRCGHREYLLTDHVRVAE